MMKLFTGSGCMRGGGSPVGPDGDKRPKKKDGALTDTGRARDDAQLLMFTLIVL